MAVNISSDKELSIDRKMREMFFDAPKMQESMLHQPLHVRVASDTQIQSSDWPKRCCGL